jgi:hypothetical protein
MDQVEDLPQPLTNSKAVGVIPLLATQPGIHLMFLQRISDIDCR